MQILEAKRGVRELSPRQGDTLGPGRPPGVASSLSQHHDLSFGCGDNELVGTSLLNSMFEYTEFLSGALKICFTISTKISLCLFIP